ncbi:MAG: hypothetical protein ACPGEF_02795 [Endozoicomonas sp.]
MAEFQGAYWSVKPVLHNDSLFTLELAENYLRERFSNKIQTMKVNNWKVAEKKLQIYWEIWQKRYST